MSGRRWEVILVLVLGGVLGLIFGGSLVTGTTVVGFRDSVYLYYPLLEWLGEFGLTQFPLWNPYCNLGIPVVGDGTAGVLYPLRVLLFLPGFSFPARYGIFLMFHLIMAAVTSYWLARRLGANRAGGTLAGMSYALSGAVLTQMSNVIYLISAAWLPLAIGGVWFMYQQQSWKWSLVAAACCALMILGGDPQMTYQVGLIAAATWMIRSLASWREVLKLGPSGNRYRAAVPVAGEVVRDCLRSGWIRQGGDLGRLLLLVLVTTSLASAQIISTWDWALASERCVPDNRSAESNLLRQQQRDFQAYQFSLPPWSLAEMAWPNFSGKLYPVHQRWSDGLPGADRVWYLSIYLGLIPFWLGISQFRFRGKSSSAWLTAIALVFCWGSFGWYGLVWLLREILPAFSVAYLGVDQLAPQVGGVYWMMDQSLPMFSLFRYPAKLFLVTSLCLSLLAGIRLNSGRRLVSVRGWLMFVLLSLGGWGSVYGGWWNSLFDNVPADAWYGCFDAHGSQRNLERSFLIGMVVLTVAWMIQGPLVLAFKKYFRWGGKNSLFAGWLLVLLTAIDLTLANRWLLAEIPADVLAKKTSINQPVPDVSEEGNPTAEVVPLVIFRSSWSSYQPLEWQTTRTGNRLAEIANWQRQSLFPKHHLSGVSQPVRLLGSFSSLAPAAWEPVWEQLERESLNWASSDPLAVESSGKRGLLEQWANVRLIPSGSDGAFEWEWVDREQKLVSVEWLQSDFQDAPSEGGAFPECFSVPRVISFACDRIELCLSAKVPCRLVHHTTHDGHWYAIIRTEAGVSRKVMDSIRFGEQGVLLDGGEYQITLEYQPAYFFWAIGQMIGSWMLLGCLLVWIWVSGKFKLKP